MFLHMRQFPNYDSFTSNSYHTLASFWLQKSLKIDSQTSKNRHWFFHYFPYRFFSIWGPFWEPFGRLWGDFRGKNRAGVSEKFAVRNALVKISSPRRLGDPIWDNFRTILGPFWYHFGTIFLSWQPQGDQDSLPSPPAPRHHRATKHRATTDRHTEFHTEFLCW